MPKNKTHKGLKKRIRITATGKIKLPRAGGRHKRSHKTGTLLRAYRASRYAVPSEAKRMSNMLFRSASIRRRTAEPAEAAKTE